MKIKKWVDFNESNLGQKSMEEVVDTCFDYIINSGEIDIYELFDNEILEWTEDDWQEDWESEYDHYIDIGNGEAEDVIFSKIVSDCEIFFNIKLNENELDMLREKIKDETGISGF